MTLRPILPGALLALGLTAAGARGAATLRVEQREFSGRMREIVVIENARVRAEIVPSDSGRIAIYRDKARPESAFEWLDDCPYHYACRWEGQPFTHTLGEQGPDRVSVTVRGGGKIAVAHLRAVANISVANPLVLEIERTMTLFKEGTRLLVDVKITNTGDGVAPRFRYMMHGVWGQVAREPFGFILPTDKGTEFFDSQRASAVFREAGRSGGDPKHPFNRFVPERPADKPRFAPGGWVALLTAAGPTYIQYDPAQFDFFQYWYGGDSTWHWTSEPHSKPVDLAPGQSIALTFSLALDADDIAFATPTLAYGDVAAPREATPGSPLAFSVRATTARNTAEAAAIAITVRGPDGQAWPERRATAEVKGFAFAELKAVVDLPVGAAAGRYTWTAATGAGQPLGSGEIEVMSQDEMARQRAERAVTEARAELQGRIDQLTREAGALRAEGRLWRDAADLLISLRNPLAWRAADGTGALNVRLVTNAVPILGNWQAREPARITAFSAPAAPAPPADLDARLARLGAERALLADVAVSPDAQTVAALLVDPAANRVQIVRIAADGTVRRFGRTAEKPGESNDELGRSTRAVAIDGQGRVWVATTVWGNVSRYVAGPDGQPSEQSVPGYKGAVKVFDAGGACVAALALLDTPTDLVPVLADGRAGMMAPYRNVSAYHGAMVREGALLFDAAAATRAGEIKLPAGSVAPDGSGGLWAADVAGHLTRHTARGKRLSSLEGAPPPAVADAVLPETSPLPTRLRAGADGTLWLLRPLQRELWQVRLTGDTAAIDSRRAIPESIGRPVALLTGADGVRVVGDLGVWTPE